ncbi:MAG TPA: ribokinase [Devosia sp.]|nr:ribokinase [Devosia sp.]
MITVLGSTSLDFIGTVSRLPKPGETVPGGVFRTAAGGKGANQALAARRAGAAVTMFAAVGDDAYASDALAELKAGGVDLTHVPRVAGVATGIAMIFVDAKGENVIAILPGANGTLGVAEAEAALAPLQRGDILMLQQEVPVACTDRALELAKEKGVISILNTAPFLPTTPTSARSAAIVIANETEFALLCGGRDEPLEQLMDTWVKETGNTIIVTLGPDGARAATPDGAFSVPAMAVVPVDTVGAGDTFCGYLAAGLDGRLDLQDAMRRAAVAASLACLKPGAQPAIPMADEVARAVR